MKNYPAFARPSTNDGAGQTGLTVREYFAVHILAGIEASNFSTEHQTAQGPGWAVKYAVLLADMLIAELKK